MTTKERYALIAGSGALAWTVLGFMESWWALIPAAVTLIFGWKWYVAK